MRHPRRASWKIVIVALVLGPLSPLEAAEVTVPVQIEPPQSVSAVAISAADGSRHSINVRGGHATVPSVPAFPWIIASARFEPLAYTKSDYEQRKPIVLRELGILRGKLECRVPNTERGFTALLRAETVTTPAEVDLVTDEAGGFEVRVPAGLYHGAFVSTSVATRIRSAILVKPGKITELGTLTCEPTVRVAMRIVDAKSGKSVPRVRVAWAPANGATNADIAQVLYGARWSSVSDAKGMVSLPSIGPVPLPVRWKIEARGYAEQYTPTVALTEWKDVTLPDVRLKPEATVVVHVVVPPDATEDVTHATVSIGEPQDSRTMRYAVVSRKPLVPADITFKVTRYGPKRLTIDDALGKPLLYRDISVDAERTVVNVPLVQSEVRGSVTRHKLSVPGATVTLADPHDARVILARSTTREDGTYSFRTYQDRGELFLYATDYSRKEGATSGTVSQRVPVDGRAAYFVDFELPDAGIQVKIVDSSTGQPLRASVERRLEFENGSQLGVSETDADGLLIVRDYPEGTTASLHINAKGHRSREVTLKLQRAVPETVVQLEPSGVIDGVVVDERGSPVRDARVSGGYSDEKAGQAHFYTTTDSQGRFHFDFAPEIGTTFYVAAARHALGITTLQPDHLNTVSLSPPNAGLVVLLADNAPPLKTELLMVVPAGGEFIPLGALVDLAEVNGMTPVQLHVSAKDGAVVLPEFLPPGSYDLFLYSLRKDAAHQRIGSVTVPLQRNALITYRTK